MTARVGEVERCPTCGHVAQQYRRKINAGMAAALLVLDRTSEPGGEYAHWPSELRDRAAWLPPSALGGDPAKLFLWGLIEGMPGDRGDGSHRNGFWRVTTKGREFARRRSKLPRNALVTDGSLDGFDGADVWITDCIGSAFDFNEAIGRLWA